MTKNKLPSQAVLLTMFRYDERRGVLCRILSDGRRRTCGRKVSIMNVDYWSARVVWKMVTGYEPKDVVYFHDGDQDNLRLRNLVELTHAERRLLGTKAHVTNGTGERGVERTASGKYKASYRLGGRRHIVGTFATCRAAAQARRAAIRRAVAGG